jgi:hypothetical protein
MSATLHRLKSAVTRLHSHGPATRAHRYYHPKQVRERESRERLRERERGFTQSLSLARSTSLFWVVFFFCETRLLSPVCVHTTHACAHSHTLTPHFMSLYTHTHTHIDATLLSLYTHTHTHTHTQTRHTLCLSTHTHTHT